jgi:hypothetical protein
LSTLGITDRSPPPVDVRGESVQNPHGVDDVASGGTGIQIRVGTVVAESLVIGQCYRVTRVEQRSDQFVVAA